MEAAKEEVISGAPQKKTMTKSNSAKASASSRTSTSPITQASATGRKFTRTSVYGKAGDEFSEDTIRDLKKNITFLNDENLVLKSKLRRSEDDNTRKEKYILQLRESTKNDNDKTAANSAMTQLKRKIQKLEQTLREKEVVIRQLQSDARIAAQSAALSTLRKESPIKSPSQPRTFPSYSPTNRISQSSLQTENERLKRQLRRALAIEDSHISQYSELGTDELISFIVRLNQDIENLKKNRKNSQPANEATAFELQTEVDKLHQEITRLKVDRLAHFEDCESKSSQIKALKQEIDKLNKEPSNARETGKKPPSPTVKRTSGLVATSPKMLPTQTQPRIGTTKWDRSSEVTATSGTTTSKVKHATPSSQTMKKTETRRTITTVTKVSTLSPVKVKTTKVTLNVAEKKGTKLATKEKASVDISTKLAEQIKQQESRAEEQAKDQDPIHPQEPPAEEKPTEEIKQEEPRPEEKIIEEIKPEEPCSEEKTVEEIKQEEPSTEINTETAVEGSVETPVADEHEVAEFRQNIAAKKIQRQWRKHHTEVTTVKEDEEELERFKQNRAAKTIQKKWRTYHEKNVKGEDGGDGEMHLTATTEVEEIHGKSGYNERESVSSSDGDDGDDQHGPDDHEMPSIIPEVVTKEQEPKEKGELEEKINGEQEHE